MARAAMMEAQIRVGKLVMKVVGETQMELFEALAKAEEVFSHEPCGLCKNEDTRFVVRHTGSKSEFTYAERQCMKCRAALTYGEKKEDSSLYPKRKLIATGPETGKPDMEHGRFGDHNGWTQWRGGAAAEAAPSTQASQQPPPQQRGGGRR